MSFPGSAFPNDPGLGSGPPLGLNQQGVLIDGAAWSASLSGLAVNLNASVNQFGMVIEGNDTVVTAAPANYEKAALLVIGQTVDASGAFTYDMAGVDARGYIAAGNLTGRVWGVYGEGRVVATGDGLSYGGEFTSNNNGTNQSATGTTTSKYGVHVVGSGTVPSTSAIYIGGVLRGGGATQSWHKGLFMETASLAGGASDSFLELQSTWRVVSTTGVVGQTLIGSATSLGVGTPLLEVQGPNATADPLVIVGNTGFSQAYSLRVANSAGAGALAIATGGAFLTDSVVGDTVLTTFTAAKSVRIGGSSTVINVTRANLLGFYGVAAVAQPSAVGTAAGYTAGATVGTFHTDDTYSGNTGATSYTINGIVAALKGLGLIHT